MVAGQRSKADGILIDEDHRVKAFALRLLIESGYEKDYSSLLENMFKSQNPEERLAACSAFRNQVSSGAEFSIEMLDKFSRLLSNCLSDERETEDCRIEAGLALGELMLDYNDSISLNGGIFTHLLEQDSSVRLRLVCIDILEELHYTESQTVLLKTILNGDEDIRFRSAEALKALLGADSALHLIIDELLEDPGEADEYYIEALHSISPFLAFNVLSERIVASSNPDMTSHLLNALEMLSEGVPLLSLQTRRKETFDTYARFLDNVNSQIIVQFRNLARHADLAFYTSLILYAILTLAATGILFYSLRIALSADESSLRFSASLGVAAGSVLAILLLHSNNPLKNLRQATTDLSRLRVLPNALQRNYMEISPPN